MWLKICFTGRNLRLSPRTNAASFSTSVLERLYPRPVYSRGLAMLDKDPKPTCGPQNSIRASCSRLFQPDSWCNPPRTALLRRADRQRLEQRDDRVGEMTKNPIGFGCWNSSSSAHFPHDKSAGRRQSFPARQHSKHFITRGADGAASGRA